MNIETNEEVVKKSNIVDKVKAFFEKPLYRFIALIVIAVAALGFTFGAISNASTSIRLVTNGEYVKHDVRQNSIKMYVGYFNAITKEESDVYGITFNQYIAQIDKYGFIENSRDATRVYSGMNLYQSAIVQRTMNATFGTTLNYFVEIVLLFIVQVIPLIFIGRLTYLFVKKENLIKAKRWLLYGGLSGVLLSVSLNTIYSSRTAVGYGLAAYMIILFGLYFAWSLNSRVQTYGCDKKGTSRYALRTVLGFVLILLVTSSYIRFVYEYEEGKSVSGTFAVADTNSLFFIAEEDNGYYTGNLFNFLDTQVTPIAYGMENNWWNASYFVRNYDYSIAMRMELMDSDAAQDTFYISLMTVSTLTVLFLLSIQFITITDVDGKLYKAKMILNGAMIGAIVVLFVLSLIHISKFTVYVEDSSSWMRVAMSPGLIISFLLAVGLLVFDIRNKKIFG